MYFDRNGPNLKEFFKFIEIRDSKLMVLAQ